MPSIDVIVPCYRYGRYLEQCVRSVLTQNVASLRVLVLDDASPDETPEVASALARSDGRVSVVRHPTNVGHIATYNEGFDWVAAKYALLLSADDYLLPGALARAIDLLEANASVGFVFGNFVTVDPSGRLHRKTLRPRPAASVMTGREFVKLGGGRNIVQTPTAVVRSALQRQLGGYLAELPHSGDMEMWLRFASRADVGFIEAPQAVYRQHGLNMSRAYSTRQSMPDIMQRKLCIDLFAANHARHMNAGPDVCNELYMSLARDVVGHASEALNEGDSALSEELVRLAESIHADVVRSPAMRRLRVKRLLGVTLCRALHRASSRTRPLNRT